MNKILHIATTAAFAALCAFGALSCSTTTTDTGYYMANKGQTQLRYSAEGKDAYAVRNAVVNALRARKWNVAAENFPIEASIVNRGQHAKVSITFENGNIVVETRGSTIDDTPYVPIRYVDFLMKTVNKNLR